MQLSAAARSLNHHRVRLVEGSSTDPHTIRVVESHLPGGGGLVVLDSEHTEHHKMPPGLASAVKALATPLKCVGDRFLEGESD